MNLKQYKNIYKILKIKDPNIQHMDNQQQTIPETPEIADKQLIDLTQRIKASPHFSEAAKRRYDRYQTNNDDDAPLPYEHQKTYADRRVKETLQSESISPSNKDYEVFYINIDL